MRPSRVRLEARDFDLKLPELAEKSLEWQGETLWAWRNAPSVLCMPELVPR